MRPFYLVASLFVCLLLQATLAPRIAFGEIAPDFVLLVVANCQDLTLPFSSLETLARQVQAQDLEAPVPTGSTVVAVHLQVLVLIDGE